MAIEWSDEGIVLSARPQGERGLLLSLLTHRHGRHAGLVRGGQGARKRPLFEPGNRLHATWRARVEESLGSYRCELLRADAATLLVDGGRLACLAAACALAEAALPERAPHAVAFAALATLIEGLVAGWPGWGEAYVLWEVALLADLGFGLELGRCAATGGNDHLAYVSPRTGRAVSASAGEPYRDRLLALPQFLTGAGDGGPAGPDEVAAGLRLTGYFLERHAVSMMPAARARLAARFEQRENGTPWAR